MKDVSLLRERLYQAAGGGRADSGVDVAIVIDLTARNEPAVQWCCRMGFEGRWGAIGQVGDLS